MKHLIYILLIIPFYSISQQVTIKVTDIESNEPLPFVNLHFKNSGVGGPTNIQGIVSFEDVVLLEKDSLIVSYIGYERHAQLYLKSNEVLTIAIKPKSSIQNLPEVVIKYVKPPKPKSIVKQVIKNVSQNYPDNPIIFKSLYRETIEENDTFIQLNEAFVNTYYTGYPQKNMDGKIWRDWYYDDSYAFELEGENYFFPLLNDFNTKEDKQIVVASRHSNSLSKYGKETVLIGDPLLLLALDKIKYQYDFFNPRLLNKYHFKHELTESINGESCYVISFYPKSVNRKFSIDQSKKNKHAIYIGRLYISKTSFALIKFQYKLAVERDYRFFEKMMPLDYNVEMNYIKREQFYFIENIKLTETRKVGEKDNGKSILHKVNKELHILDIDKDKVTPFADSLLFKSTRFSSIRHFKKNYNPHYWDDFELDESLQLSKKIIADLEKNEPLNEQFLANKTKRKLDILKPIAFKEEYVFNYHNNKTLDSLHWMASPANDAKLKKYLTEENKYAKNALIEQRQYQKKLFSRLNNFYQPKPNSKKTIKPETYYIEEDSLNNELIYYQKDSINRVLALNLSSFEDRYDNVFIKQVIPNQSRDFFLILCHKIGVINDFAIVLPFGSSHVIDSIPNLYTVHWSTNSTLLYSKANKLGSARTLNFRDTRTAVDSVIYEEFDPRFDVEVNQKGQHLFCTVQSKTENEIYLIEERNSFPKLTLIKRRQTGVNIDINTNDGIHLLVNSEDTGSSIEFYSFRDLENGKLLVKSDKEDYITSILPLQEVIIAKVYENSIPKLKFFDRNKKKWKDLKIDLGIGDFGLISKIDSTNSFLFSFSSPSHPYAQYRYSLNTNKLKPISKKQSLNSFYHKYNTCERAWAKSHDGTKVPITIIKNSVSNKKERGLILRVYGAYGAITTPSFNAQDAILLEQGYTIAYAHVRGESILGKSWYKSGRKLKKENSILDYISCANYLIEKGYTSSDLLIGYGNSAGGLIVAQAANKAPSLFNTIILDHPFLDVVNTMMSDSLPLTKDEYKEWGDPKEKEIYEYIRNYSPYQNIESQPYPNALLIASFQDYQTPIWQVAKYCSRLSENNLSNSEIIMLTDFKSGHMGNRTGKEWIKLYSQIYSFVNLNVNKKNETN